MLLRFLTPCYQYIALAFCLNGFLSGVTFCQERHFPAGTQAVHIMRVEGVRGDLLQEIAPIIKHSIAAGNYPGAVVLAAHRGHIIYRGIFGNRRIVPDVAPMRFDTIFDLASLTKVIATTPAIMQLIEEGKLDLDAHVEKYWPGFAYHGKETVTIRELLTHTSGLPEDLPSSTYQPKGTYPVYFWRGEDAALQRIMQLKLSHPAGTVFVYSDINFIVLSYLVELISGERFDHYVQHHVLSPLEMHHTYFLPPKNLRDRIAPTEIFNNRLHWGEVHDPSADAMGGVSGNAGLFSDANDLGIYAQCLLNHGRLPHTFNDGKMKSNYLLGPLAIDKMTTPQNPPSVSEIRGLGWDIDSSFSNRGVLFPVNSFGHTGWTGTSMWIDPVTQTWLIILTSRTHPTRIIDSNPLIDDRRAIADIVAASVTDISTGNINTGVGELSRAYKL